MMTERPTKGERSREGGAGVRDQWLGREERGERWGREDWGRRGLREKFRVWIWWVRGRRGLRVIYVILIYLGLVYIAAVEGKLAACFFFGKWVEQTILLRFWQKTATVYFKNIFLLYCCDFPPKSAATLAVSRPHIFFNYVSIEQYCCGFGREPQQYCYFLFFLLFLRVILLHIGKTAAISIYSTSVDFQDSLHRVMVADEEPPIF